jgi:HK97 family phage prohead protease
MSLNRSLCLGFEADNARRDLTAPFELRKDAQANTAVFRGYASTTEQAYDIYGGGPYGWTETVARGAFKKTLAENADVAFLINHEGIALARTKSGTMTLREDQTGLAVTANLDLDMPEVFSLYKASKRGDVDEMSFAFRVTRDEWTDRDGEPATPMDGVNRRITEVSLHKGDVSAVNYGANDTTSGGFRSFDRAMAEVRAGREVSDPRQREAIRSLAAAIGEAPVVPNEQLAQIGFYLTQIDTSMEAIRSLVAPLTEPTSEPAREGVTLFEGVEVLATLRAMHEQRAEPVSV